MGGQGAPTGPAEAPKPSTFSPSLEELGRRQLLVALGSRVQMHAERSEESPGQACDRPSLTAHPRALELNLDGEGEHRA